MIAKHMIRTLMIETPSVPGNLGRVATAIGLLGGDIGEVETVKSDPITQCGILPFKWRMKNSFRK